MKFFHLFRIIITLQRFGLYKILREYERTSFLAAITSGALFFIPTKFKNKSLPERTRLAFEELGPVFIKFGQLLSTRQDLIPPEYVEQLSKLQSQVKPFSSEMAEKIIETSLKCKIETAFDDFESIPVAAASIAQVHKARLKTSGEAVAIKILRPNIAKLIDRDIKVLRLAAWFIEKISRDGKWLRPREIVDEFEKTIHAELDFLQEAANAAELYRLHKNDSQIIIPRIFYDYCSTKVLVLEWMDGTPIADLTTLRKKNIDLKKLSHSGVSIFYTQVFHYGFFHADMHPGNILCDDSGHYIALDFGIVGCLSEEDKRYLAINILAFFNRDYKKVAITHVESGWAPSDTPIEELEHAIRTVCEPIFNKPLSQISFGQVLIKLFQVSRKFNIAVQPQLILLQKTIVNVEGLGRLLNPDLDLWITAKPILEKWMRQQMGIRGFMNNLKTEIPYWSYSLPRLPRILTESIQKNHIVKQQNEKYLSLLKSYRNQNKILLIVAFAAIIFIVFILQK